jgi:hypothetical protein
MNSFRHCGIRMRTSMSHEKSHLYRERCKKAQRKALLSANSARAKAVSITLPKLKFLHKATAE